MSKYKLSYYYARGLAEVPRLIFAYAKVPFEDVRIPLGSLTDKKKAEWELPWGQVPLLEVDGKKFGQSVAISRYLARKYKLVGQDEFDELRCDEIVDAFQDYFQKWIPVLAMKLANTDESKIKEAVKPLLEVDTPRDLSRFNEILENSPNGWFVGKRLAWADIHVVHFLTHLEALFGVKLTTNFPALQTLVDNVQNTPGIKEWIAKRPKTLF